MLLTLCQVFKIFFAPIFSKFLFCLLRFFLGILEFLLTNVLWFLSYLIIISLFLILGYYVSPLVHALHNHASYLISLSLQGGSKEK